jgi:pimeloyl-ACP methyl ester carboxylesterase
LNQAWRATCEVKMQILEVDGTEVLIEGQGDHTIVMLHGWPDTHALWDAQVAALAPQWRCVRFTLPGFDLRRGRRGLALDAMTAHLAAIVDAVSPDRPVTLMLHDWGAVYGYQYAMRHAERVARLVGVDVGEVASGEFVRSLPLKAKLGIAAYQGWLALAYKLPAALGDRMTRWMARQLRAPAPAAHIAAQMNHPYVANWTGGFRRSQPVRPRCPMLYFFGQRKPFMFHASAWAERIAASPGGAVHGLPTGHWVMIQQPEAFNRILLGWLQATHTGSAPHLS